MVMNLGLNPLISPEARDNPYPFFAMARQMMPVLRLEQFGVWSAFLYEDCRNILRDSKRFCSSFIRRMPEGQARPRPSMLNSDPPRHTRLRELVNKAFTPRMVAQLEPRVRSITDELVDAVLPTGSLDLIDDLA